MGESENVGLAFGLVILAGLMAPVGAMISWLVPPERMDVIPISLAFAAGILIWVALAALHPEALEAFEAGIEADYPDDADDHVWRARLYTLLSIMLGMFVGAALDWLIHKLGASVPPFPLSPLPPPSYPLPSLSLFPYLGRHCVETAA